MRHQFFAFALLGGLATVIGCGTAERQSSPQFEIIGRFPHDSTAYTQGLLWADSVVFESTGRYGRSEIRRVDLRSGQVLTRRSLPPDRFGEGLALLDNRLYQLTWKAGVAYVYDAATLMPIDSFYYAGEGWGLTTDGTSLIMSDGSDSLRIISPKTFEVEHVVHVRFQSAPLYKLNELEYVDGDVLANVYESNWVLRINLKTGTVREVLDFTELYSDRPVSAEVMNGIAMAPDGKQLLLTGKLWPVLFQVRLRSPQEKH